LIAAAGSGQRLGAGGPKAFVQLAGRPLLDHALGAVAASATIDRVVVASPAGHEAEAEELLAGHDRLRGAVLAGGDSRAASVRAGLEAVADELVLVHDAARPLAPPSLFDAIVGRLRDDPDLAAVIAAAPIVDTVKRSVDRHDPGAGPGQVEATLGREHLWAAQTPQGCRTEALREAQRAAEAEGRLAAATDEAALIEALGGAVLLERSAAENLKVTDANDLRVAEALLRARSRV
jgi:2-C-methyl-D-erythritol 4-phosphate cytidylyltransferase